MKPKAPFELYHSLCLESFLESGKTQLFEKALPLVRQIPFWHFQMLADEKRLRFYEDIIRGNVTGKIVLDLGAGTGILSWLALKHGAKKVIAVEMNPSLQAVLSYFLKTEIAEGRVELISRNAMDLTREDFSTAPEIIVHELFGSDGFQEKLIPVLTHMKNILPGETKILPDRLALYLEPVKCPRDERNTIKDFAGFPLSKLNSLLWMSSLVRPPLTGEKTTGPSVELISVDLSKPDIKKLEARFSCHEIPSHLRLRIRPQHGEHVLEAGTDSHWGNVYFMLPDLGEKKEFLARFELGQWQELELVSVE